MDAILLRSLPVSDPDLCGLKNWRAKAFCAAGHGQQGVAGIRCLKGVRGAVNDDLTLVDSDHQHLPPIPLV